MTVNRSAAVLSEVKQANYGAVKLAVQCAVGEIPPRWSERASGLTDEETRELLTTRDIGRAVQLVRKGLDAKIGLVSLAE